MRRERSGGEGRIAALLRGGVIGAALLLVAAQLLALLRGAPITPQPLPLDRLFAEAGAARIAAELGILILGVTPLARVALSVGVYARRGEGRQAAIGAGVLALLLVGALLGLAEA